MNQTPKVFSPTLLDRASKALASGLGPCDYDDVMRLFALADRMAQLVERMALGTRLDAEGLNHDDDSLAELIRLSQSHVTNNDVRMHITSELKSISFQAMDIWLEIDKL